MASKTSYVPAIASGSIALTRFVMRMNWYVGIWNVIPKIGLHGDEVLAEVCNLTF